MGENNIITKKVACPHCHNELKIQGFPGQTVEITCPKCDAKGIFPFPGKKPVKITTDGPYAIKVDNLEFTYPKSNKKAVDGISFSIKKGEIFGFLGPNGAGKTTTQKVIIGLLKEFNGNKEFSQCCGGGGGVRAGMPELANEIAKNKDNSVKELEVDAILSACPFCKLNISQNTDIPTLDIVEYLLKSLRGERL